MSENSWRQSFESVCRELEMANRKKNALDDLLAKNRMSRPTYEYLSRNLDEEISRLEIHLKSLTKNMNKRIDELRRQIRLLEGFLAHLELLHVGFEVDEETYNQQKDAIIDGIEASKGEMREIEKALEKIGNE